MPLEMAHELRFPMGATSSLDNAVVNDFLSLMKKVSAPMGKQQVIEIYKQHLCKVSGDYYAKSSSLDWAESDMSYQASNAAKDAPNFIAAVYDAFEELEQSGAVVPKEQNLNQILSKHQAHFEIVNGHLNSTGAAVAAPQVTESISTAVIRALGDAKALIGTVDSSSAIDRAHTALHGYLGQLCSDANITLASDATVSKAFKELRKSHPALLATGHRASEISKVLNSFAASIDAFSTLRNHASLVHVNDLLDVPEATATVNAMYTIFRYVQDSLARYNQSFV
ncbi:abortive infection family protein [Vibrio harveyi]|uniref:abortive infection family protein n=1 Tax=Vibrio parahaemolyticus TaxID=670 RepID=UPI002AF86266|nr:abortive infection family protein [Vibrio harveyi]